jgi:hypothetical protein
MTWYVAHIEIRDDVIAVSFPDMPSIRVVDDTVEKALETAAWLLKEELQSLVAKGIKLGSPTRLLDLTAENESVRYALIEISKADAEGHDTLEPAADIPFD